MAKIDTTGSATMYLTEDEYGAVLERVRADAPGSELAAILAEAQPTENPQMEVVGEGEDASVVYFTYAITLPPGEHELAADALRAEVGDDPAAIVAEHTIDEGAPS